GPQLRHKRSKPTAAGRVPASGARRAGSGGWVPGSRGFATSLMSFARPPTVVIESRLARGCWVVALGVSGLAADGAGSLPAVVHAVLRSDAARRAAAGRLRPAPGRPPDRGAGARSSAPVAGELQRPGHPGRRPRQLDAALRPSRAGPA